MRIQDMYLTGLGVHLPDVVSVASAVERGAFPPQEAESTQLTGVAVAGDVPAPEMALAASTEAVKRSGQDAATFDLLLYASSWHQGPDGWLPQSYLQRHLVGGKVPAYEIRQGCNGVFAALELASGFLRGIGKASATALVVAADNFGTPLVNRWQTGAGYLPADGASAVTLSTQGGFAELVSLCSVTVAEAEAAHRGDEPLFPPGATVGRAVDYAARAEAFRRDAGSTALFLQVQQQAVMVATQALAEAQIGIAEIAAVAFNNFSREMVEQRCMRALGLDLSLSTWEFGRALGHMGASDQLVALDHLISAGALGAGDNVLLAGLGPGINVAAAVVRILSTPRWAG